MTAAEQQKTIRFDPRTKILLMVFSVFVATTAPNLWYECILILLIAVFGFLCGKLKYALIGTVVFMVLYFFTTLYLQEQDSTYPLSWCRRNRASAFPMQFHL